MERSLRNCAFALLCLGSSTTLAEDWFATFDLGRADEEVSAGDADPVSAFALGVGRELGEFAALRLEWHDYGAIETRTIPVCPAPLPSPCQVASLRPETALALRLEGRLPLGEAWSLRGSLGMARWEGDFVVDASGTQFIWSVGAARRLDERWEIGLDYLDWGEERQYFRGFDRLALNLRYRF